MNEFEIIVAKNAATNGRVFCVLVVAISLCAFVITRSAAFGASGLLAAISVGLAALTDPLPYCAVKKALVMVTWSAGAASAVILLLLLLLRV